MLREVKVKLTKTDGPHGPPALRAHMQLLLIITLFPRKTVGQTFSTLAACCSHVGGFVSSSAQTAPGTQDQDYLKLPLTDVQPVWEKRIPSL